MIEDDYFFIVYRILDCLYINFKEGNGVKFPELRQIFSDINGHYLCNILESLQDMGDIKDFETTRESFLTYKITMAGIEYLLNDTRMLDAAMNIEPEYVNI